MLKHTPVLVCTFTAILSAQAKKDWPTHGGDSANTRYSALKQIDRGNVGRLATAWTYHMAPPAAGGAEAKGGGGNRGRASQATPIMAEGLLYMPTPSNRVVALEPETGKEAWVYDVPNNSQASMRGVEYWPGDAQSSSAIFFGTTDGYLVALNAKTGKLIPGFGNEGRVNLKEGVNNGFANGNFSLSSPPRAYKNVVITGARVQEQPANGFAGDTRGWDARTGKLLWTFHSVPRPGEAGHETWETPGSWEKRSGTNVWGQISIDTKLGLVYLPHGSPSPDFWGGDRKGSNLYGNTLVALDAQTGKERWHFQTIHHDTWDYDLQSAPILMDIKKDGRTIPALSLTSKTGLVFILDRRDGKPVHGVEERPVPASDVPGEFSWPTEPFPVKPAPLARMSFKESELNTYTPEQEKFCRDMWALEGGMHNDGPFTRYGAKLSVVFPGTIGAQNWHGGSWDPATGYLFYNISNQADVSKVVQNPPGSAQPFTRQSPGGGFGRFWNPDNFWPCQVGPWGELVAINAGTGDIAWRVPLGVIPELEAKGIKNTGTLNIGGSIATAGGLVFIGASNDRRFRAFDTRTGKVLWETQLEAGAYTGPMTFQGKNGKQYVVVIATGGSFYDRKTGDSVVAFALP